MSTSTSIVTGVDFVSIPTSDFDAAVDFYGNVLGLENSSTWQRPGQEAVGAEFARLTMGPPEAEETGVGPAVTDAQASRVRSLVEEASGEGAELIRSHDEPGSDYLAPTVVLGEPGDGGPAGTLVRPLLVETGDPESELAREELFGPLLTLVRADDLGAALEFVNGSRYGNAGSIFTTSGGAARAYRWGAEAGMLGVNIRVATPVACRLARSRWSTTSGSSAVPPDATRDSASRKSPTSATRSLRR